MSEEGLIKGLEVAIRIARENARMWWDTHNIPFLEMRDKDKYRASAEAADRILRELESELRNEKRTQGAG